FREMGILPEAFVNMLALLCWYDGSDQRPSPLEELVARFSVGRISQAGARAEFVKATSRNPEWIERRGGDRWIPPLARQLTTNGVSEVDPTYLAQVVQLVKDRLTLLTDFWDQASLFFRRPAEYDLAAVQPKWTAEKPAFFTEMTAKLENFSPW